MLLRSIINKPVNEFNNSSFTGFYFGLMPLKKFY